jgi:hypothetical protein
MIRLRHFRHVLYKCANEDVSLGSWFVGLDIEHVDDRRRCCGTPPGMVDAFPFFGADSLALPEIGWCTRVMSVYSPTLYR